MTPLRLAIAGATGRTGRSILALAQESPDFEVVAAISTTDDPHINADAGEATGLGQIGVALTAACEVECDALIEFTLPPGCRAWANWCAQANTPLVSGTTGLGDGEKAALRAAAEHVPVVWSPNMSVGVNLLMQLTEDAARKLGVDWDIEISETHHRHKIDAPSGTARALYELVCAARQQDTLESATYGRYGQCGPRQPGEVGVHAIRLGDNVGEHVVHFGGVGETLTLHHRAQSRQIFAAGALKAARWAVEQPPGYYHMRDALSDR